MAEPSPFDRLRRLPAPALALIAVGSFFLVPFVAGLFGAGTDTAAQANVPPAGDSRRSPVPGGNLAGGFPTYMPGTLGAVSAVPPAPVAGIAPFGGGGGGFAGGGSGGGGGQSPAPSSGAPKPAPGFRRHFVSHWSVERHFERGPQVAAAGAMARRVTSPPMVRPVMPVASYPAAPVYRPAAPMMRFGGGMMGGGFRSFGGGGGRRR